MTRDNDARVWLRANGHADVADQIDAIMADWHRRKVKTRRNWWDVLAGDLDGNPKAVQGVTFPVLAAARRRKGWPPCDAEIGPREMEPQRTATGRSGRQRTKRRGAQARAPGGSAPSPAVSHEPRGHRNGSAALATLTVQNFAQLEHVELPLADLVVLVGPQATGKSLVLELLKLAIDRNRIVRVLKQHGYKWERAEELAALYFGGGFERSWTASTRIRYKAEELTLRDIAKSRYSGEDSVFYIPAHRTLALADGWPRRFTEYQVDTPYVARRFSEELLTALNHGLGKGKIFPHDRRLKDAFRKLIDDAVFHGAALKLDVYGMRKQFVLEYEDTAKLPFMAWTAGQREFTPLLLGLYHLLPPGGSPPKRTNVEWAIIEEPEMGLHPKAIVAVMAVVLDLLARGYKVALSTHSPTVLEVIWGMSQLKGVRDGPARLCKMMGLPDRDQSVLRTAAEALKRTYSVVHLQHDQPGRVVSKDISNLNPGAADQREWNWGGLIGFSATVNDMVANIPQR